MTAPEPAAADRAAHDATVSDTKDAAPAGQAPTARLSAASRFRHRLVTPQAIYGTLLVSAIIGTSEDGDSDAEIFITAASTMLVFWIAHVFADGIAHYGATSAQGQPMRVSLKHSVRLASGLLYASVIPLFCLALGAVGLVEEHLAYSISLLLPVLILGALGWYALADRGSTVWGRFVGSIVTALLGIFVILLKVAFH